MKKPQKPPILSATREGIDVREPEGPLGLAVIVVVIAGLLGMLTLLPALPITLW